MEAVSQLSALLACQSREDVRRLWKVNSHSFIPLACKHNRTDLLKFLLEEYTPDRVFIAMELNYEGHNAIYYAIRSSNIDLLRTLLESVHPELLERLVSESYEELLLNNVLLSEEMHVYIQYKLIDIRFFSREEKAPSVTSSAHIQERITLLQENIVDLNTCSEVDSNFLYMAKFIAHNIHILKHQLKSTYTILPWEEMEFCLVTFVSAHIRRHELNLFYLSVLRKDRLLKELHNFACALQELEEYVRSTNARKLYQSVFSSREDFSCTISSRYPDLCADYKEVRDVSSLHIMKTYQDAALLADPATRLGQLTIKRALQVTGEHMKNTLDSPKLSSAMSDLILLSAPPETRKILQGLRNSLSHPHPEFEDTEIYARIKNDIKKIISVITDIINSYKAQKIMCILTTLATSDNEDEILRFVELRRNVCIIDNRQTGTDIKDYQNHEDLIRDVESIKNKLDLTPYENKLFAEIKDVAGKTKIDFFTIIINYFWFLTRFVDFDPYDHSKKSLDIVMKKFKTMANKVLKNFSKDEHSSENENCNLLNNLLIIFFNSVLLRVKPEIAIEISLVVLRMKLARSFNRGNINGIDEYHRQILFDNFVKNYNLGEKYNARCVKKSNDKMVHEQLTVKLTELMNTIGTDRMCGQLYEHILTLHKDENTNRLIVEALVLDIMTLLDSSKHFLNNVLYLDGNIPMLSGKCLRNHLAHSNAMVDILSTNAWSAILLNAVKLSESRGHLLNSNVGHILKHDIKQLRRRYDKGLYILCKQKDMWKSVLDGNFENFLLAIEQGADICSRKEDLSSTLHYAARGPNFEILIFLTKQVLINTEAKNSNGQTALHVAATFGNNVTIKFLVKEMGNAINQVDDAGKTPLHLASQNGHKKAVVTLLLLEAKTTVKDNNGHSPLYYAVRNNFLDVVIILLQKHANIDVNINMEGATSLHIAAENNNIEVVQYLLQNEADVNVKTHQGISPLYMAASHGHLKIVNILLEKGAYVNFRDSKGYSAIYKAVLNNHGEIIKILLKKGAFVNIGDVLYNNTPFHIAVLNGNALIVGLLLQHKANVNAKGNDGFTPLLFAAKGGHAEIVDLLLQNGALIESRDVNGSTALHIAALYGYASVVETLILAKINIHAQNIRKETPLHLASQAGHQQVVDILLSVGVNVNSVDDEGYTSLHLSSMEGHTAISETLLKKGAKVSCVNNQNYTPLHVASKTDNVKSIQLLLNHGADVNEKGKLRETALHIASFAGNSMVVEALLQGTAEVNAENNDGYTALHLAASGNHKTTVEILLKYGADINHLDTKGSSALSYAVNNNNIDLLNILINRGADVTIGGGTLLFSAITSGYRHVVEYLLKNNDLDINMKDRDGSNLLCKAAKSGDGLIARMLIKRGIKVKECTQIQSPLLIAFLYGHTEFVEILLENGADVNSVEPELSPLYIAISSNMPVERLLHWGANSNIRDSKNRTPLELAVGLSQKHNIEKLLQQPGVRINERGTDNWTLLHIAAQAGNLEIIRLLVDRGADINARHIPGAKPIHIAARNGHIDIITFFTDLGMSIDDSGFAGQTLIHYAATGGQLAVAQYLIDKHVDINSTSLSGLKPIHCSAQQEHTDMIKFLLHNGAVYDATDIFGRTPSDFSTSRDIKELLQSIGKLFEAVKKNDILMVGILAKDLAKYVNVKSSYNATLLHIASKNGCQSICDILLKIKANPNLIGEGGYAPLHYASKYSYPGIVESLLKNGAVHDIMGDCMKTPMDFAIQKDVKSLLKRVALCFRKVKSHDVEVINDINKIRNIEFIKAVMKARDTDGNTLVIMAMKNNFPNIEELKQVSQANVTRDLLKVESMFASENFAEGLDILKQLLNVRIDILGEDNPGTLDIQFKIAVALYKQCKYFEVMPMLEDTYKKRVDVFGPYNPISLETKSAIALLLHQLGRNGEAWDIFREIIPRQQKVLDEEHEQVLLTKTHAGLTLYALYMFEEALRLNIEVYKILKKKLPAYHPHVLIMQNNIATVSHMQGKFHEAFSMFQTVYEARKMIFGLNHSDTLRARFNMANVLVSQHNLNEALQVFQEVLAIQKNVFGLNHADTIHSQRLITELYVQQRDLFNAAKVYEAGLNARIATLGPNHSLFTELDKFLNIYQGHTHIPCCDFNLLKAASEGDRHEVYNLIESGSDVNTVDDAGRTALHFASTVEITELLLDNGADATAVSQKGNTPLHLATSRACGQTVRILLQNVEKTKRKAFSKFINAKTVVGGSTALHVAAGKGFADIVSCLLEHGACYNIRDIISNYTPLQCSRSPSVTRLLRLAEDVFEMAWRGGTVLPKGDERHLVAVVNSRDTENRTPVQLALVNYHNGTARLLLGLLKKSLNLQQDTAN